MKPTLNRDQVALRLACSHGELGRLLREKRAPLPVRIEGTILWFEDEVEQSKTRINQILARRRKIH